MNDQLLKEIDEFLDTIKADEYAISFAHKCFDPKTPSHELSLVKVYSNILGLYHNVALGQNPPIPNSIQQ